MSDTPLFYHNDAPVMLGTIPIYLIWYGTWSAKQKIIVTDFIDNVSNSDWLNIITTYYQYDSQHCSASVRRALQATDSYSQGKTIDLESNIYAVFNTQFDTGIFPEDDNAMYVVLTSADVDVVDLGYSFCTAFCGFHMYYTRPSGASIKVSWVGDTRRCQSMGGRCWAQTIGPNGDAGMGFKR